MINKTKKGYIEVLIIIAIMIFLSFIFSTLNTNEESNKFENIYCGYKCSVLECEKYSETQKDDVNIGGIYTIYGGLLGRDVLHQELTTWKWCLRFNDEAEDNINEYRLLNNKYKPQYEQNGNK